VPAPFVPAPEIPSPPCRTSRCHPIPLTQQVLDNEIPCISRTGWRSAPAPGFLAPSGPLLPARVIQHVHMIA